MQEQARVTVALSPKTVAIYKRMAKAGGLSFSKCVSEWLTDTADAAEFVSGKMQEARKAPAMVMNEMLGIVSGLKGEILDVKHKVAEAKSAASDRRAAGRFGPMPPSSNTGVYGSRKRGPK